MKYVLWFNAIIYAIMVAWVAAPGVTVTQDVVFVPKLFEQALDELQTAKASAKAYAETCQIEATGPSMAVIAMRHQAQDTARKLRLEKELSLRQDDVLKAAEAAMESQTQEMMQICFPRQGLWAEAFNAKP